MQENSKPYHVLLLAIFVAVVGFFAFSSKVPSRPSMPGVFWSPRPALSALPKAESSGPAASEVSEAAAARKTTGQANEEVNEENKEDWE